MTKPHDEEILAMRERREAARKHAQRIRLAELPWDEQCRIAAAMAVGLNATRKESES